MQLENSHLFANTFTQLQNMAKISLKSQFLICKAVLCVVGRWPDSQNLRIQLSFLKTLGDTLLIRMLIRSSCHMLSPSVGGLALELLDCL